MKTDAFSLFANRAVSVKLLTYAKCVAAAVPLILLNIVIKNSMLIKIIILLADRVLWYISKPKLTKKNAKVLSIIENLIFNKSCTN